MKSVGNDDSRSATRGCPYCGEGPSMVPLPFWRMGVEFQKKEASTKREIY